MKRSLILIAVASCFLLPVIVFAGNTNPRIYVEVWEYAEVPDPVPTDVCVHTTRPVGGIHCYDAKLAYNIALVAIHMGHLDEPICPTQGPPCQGTSYGGWVGLPFGMSTTGEALVFQSWTACPGFLKGPSAAGEPAACLAASTIGCRDWWDHLGYLSYLNLSTRTGATFFAVTASADLGHNKNINCGNQYDENTTIAYGAQWGGTNTLTCPGTPDPVEETSWSKIKTLFK